MYACVENIEVRHSGETLMGIVLILGYSYHTFSYIQYIDHKCK